MFVTVRSTSLYSSNMPHLRLLGVGSTGISRLFVTAQPSTNSAGLQQAPSSRAGCTIRGHSHHPVSVTHLSEASPTCIHPPAKRLIMKALLRSASSKVKLLSSNHLFKLVLFILSSSNYQWLCLSLAFLFHCELETTISISFSLSLT